MSEHSAQWFRTALTQIASAWPTMLDASSSGGAIGGERNPSRPPVSIEVLSLRQEVTAWLASMCLLVIQERELDTRSLDGNDVPLMCRWLEPHVEWVIEHEAGEAFTEELQAWARQVVRMVEPGEPKPDPIVASPMAEGGDLLRVPDAEGMLRCSVTGSTRPVADWFRLRFPDLDRGATIAELAERDGVSQDRMRDRLRKAGMEAINPGRRPALYDLAAWQWKQAMRGRMSA